MNSCPFCNGKVEQTDKFGTSEECELCGTVFRIMPMERKDEPAE